MAVPLMALDKATKNPKATAIVAGGSLLLVGGTGFLIYKKMKGSAIGKVAGNLGDVASNLTEGLAKLTDFDQHGKNIKKWSNKVGASLKKSSKRRKKVQKANVEYVKKWWDEKVLKKEHVDPIRPYKDRALIGKRKVGNGSLRNLQRM